MGWHSADFSGDGWKTDFEARYPDKNTDTTKLQALAEWLVSTDTDQATGNAITPVTYDGVTYTTDTAEYRLAKYSAELSDHFVEEAIIFYYLFTEMFLSIDQREKNAFPTYIAELDRWIVLFYDADSSLGTDNKGNLAFDYYLEDIDYTEGGDPVYNGQNSVLWKNLRATRYNEIMAMYQDLRTQNKVSYDYVSNMFSSHQDVWPEAIFNEDMHVKCLEPLINDGDGLYLPMLQGKKEQWIKWWLYNRFRYLDSKYVTGTSMTNRITIRAHNKANITLKSYVNMYGHVYFNAAVAEHRMTRGIPYEFEWPASGAEDPVIGINDADLLTDLGDLSPLMVELIDVSGAPHITNLKIGDGSEDYANYSLNSVTVGNNKLLRTLDIRNCPNMTAVPDVSGCTNIEEIYAEGSAITGIKLPNGGVLKKLHLPDTVVSLQIINQPKLTDFSIPSFSQITTLRLEHIDDDVINPLEVLDEIAANSRVRIIGFNKDVQSVDEIRAFYDKLDTMRGLDENGNNVDKPQLSGTIHVPSILGSELAELQLRYPTITIAYDTITSYLYFYNDDGTKLLYTCTCVDGAHGMYVGSEPTKASTAQYEYDFIGWSKTPGSTTVDNDALANVTADRNVYAVFSATVRTYTVKFYNGTTLLQTVNNVPYGGSAEYTGDTPAKTDADVPEDWKFSGFSPDGKNITGATSCYAQYKYDGYVYVKLVEHSIDGDYVNDEITSIGAYAFCDTPDLASVKFKNAATMGNGAFQNSGIHTAEFYAATSIADNAFSGCSALEKLIIRSSTVCLLGGVNALANADNAYIYVPSALVDSYKGATNWSAYASRIRALEDYRDEITDYSWEGVSYYIEKGNYASVYKIGDTIPLDLGTEGVINMQIAAFDVDDLADGSGKAPITWISKELLKTSKRFNPALVTLYDYKEQAATGGTNNNTSVSANSTKTTNFRTYIQAEEVAEITNTINVTADGTLTITYKGVSASYGKLEVVVNGETIVPDYASTTAVSHTVEVVSGDVVTVVARYTSVLPSSGYALVAFKSTGTFTITTSCNDVLIRYVSGYQEDTGSIGGWEKSELRAYYQNTLQPLIPESVSSAIKAVTKTHPAYDTAGTKYTQTTTDEVWIPSKDEAFGSFGAYNSLFPDNASRIKYKAGATSASYWWFRSANNSSNFDYVGPSGTAIGSSAANASYALVLGFCT